MIKTKGILHVTIPVSDLARSRAFYTEILGLEFVAQVPKETPHFVFLKSGADYVILGRDTSSGRFSDIIHHAFMVDGDAYDATVAELKAKGVDVFREDQRDEGVFTGRSAYFHDPDNNALEVIHFTNTAKGISEPTDLIGRKVGTKGYLFTAGLWMRGILEHDYGVPHKSIEWLSELDEDVDFTPPLGLKITQVPHDKSLED